MVLVCSVDIILIVVMVEVRAVHWQNVETLL